MPLPKQRFGKGIGREIDHVLVLRSDQSSWASSMA